MKKYVLLLTLFYTVSIFSCKKNSDFSEVGTVRNYTGFDGCGFIIESDNGKKFELKKIPVGFTLIANKKVSFKYVLAPGASICMIGDMIEITSIEYI